MSGDPMSKVAAYNRLSLRAVLVKEGEDPSAALAEAGIVNAVALPVFVGEEVDLSGGIFGDGRTPNITAVLETEQAEGLENSAPPPPDLAPPSSAAGRTSGPVATNLPAAFGTQPLAPVRKDR